MTDAHGEPTRLLFTDLLGLSHGKTVPAGRADHPTHYAITVMVQGLDREFIEVDNYSDARCRSAHARDCASRSRPGKPMTWTRWSASSSSSS